MIHYPNPNPKAIEASRVTQLECLKILTGVSDDPHLSLCCDRCVLTEIADALYRICPSNSTYIYVVIELSGEIASDFITRTAIMERHDSTTVRSRYCVSPIYRGWYFNTACESVSGELMPRKR